MRFVEALGSCSLLPVFLQLLLPSCGDAHGSLVFPASRNAVDRFLPPFLNGQSPQTPCTCPNNGTRGPGGDHGSLPCDQGRRALAGGQPCLWWSQGCTIGCPSCDGVNTQSHGASLCANPTTAPTLPRWAWTMNVGLAEGEEDIYKFHPWRAPGSAPVADPCGMAGGTAPSHGGGGADAVFTNTSLARFGQLGSEVLPYAPSGTVWLAGSSVEVGWAIRYNHGGGYQYRLCPKPAAGEALTEACFQRTPLAFDRTKQALMWNNGTRLALPGRWVDKGVRPAGSTWAVNPVPRMGEESAGCLARNASFPLRNGCVSFAPPCPQDCSGQPNCTTAGHKTGGNTVQGACSGDWTGGQVVDTLLIPNTLPAGEWVLGWRWDCEETTQIWQSCADVTICVPGEECNPPAPYKPPAAPSPPPS